MFESQSPDRINELEAMRAGVDYRFPVRMREFSMTLRPLALLEQMHVEAEVRNKMTMAPESLRTSLTESSIRAKETLKRASTSDFGASDEKITDYILDRMTSDEVLFLYDHYVAGCEKVNPALETMPSSELKEMVESLKGEIEGKKKDPNLRQELGSALTRLSLKQLRDVCLYLILGD